jgi:hypothetical protein
VVVIVAAFSGSGKSLFAVFGSNLGFCRLYYRVVFLACGSARCQTIMVPEAVTHHKAVTDCGVWPVFRSHVGYTLLSPRLPGAKLPSRSLTNRATARLACH